MKRTLALVLLAAMAVWAGLIYRPARTPKPKPTLGASSVQSPTHEAGAPVARPHAGEPVPKSAAATSNVNTVERAAATSGTQTPASNTPSLRFYGKPSSSSTASSIMADNARAADTTVERPQVDPSGELGEGILSPDFVELETDYVNEHREGPWALAHEQRIRQAIYDAGLAERMVLVHCQSSVCRLHFEASGPDSYAELLRVPGLVQATGLTPTTPYSMNTTELIVYARPPAIPEPAQGKP